MKIYISILFIALCSPLLLLSKNNLIIAENKLAQAKYKLVLQNKIVEYYLGKPIDL